MVVADPGAIVRASLDVLDLHSLVNFQRIVQVWNLVRTLYGSLVVYTCTYTYAYDTYLSIIHGGVNLIRSSAYNLRRKLGLVGRSFQLLKWVKNNIYCYK